MVDFDTKRTDPKSSVPKLPFSKLPEGSLEMIGIFLCGCGLIYAAIIGIPSVGEALDSLVGVRFTTWLLSSSLLSQVFKWLSVAGLVYLVIRAFSNPGPINYLVAIVATAILIRLLRMSAIDAGEQVLDLGMKGLQILAWGLMNGVQVYVLVQRMIQKTGRDKTWNTLVIAALIAYAFEVSINIVYNPAFSPVRSFTFGGGWIDTLISPDILPKIGGFILSVLLMLGSVVLVEGLIITMFTLYRRMKNA